jgi:hypothetical protein
VQTDAAVRPRDRDGHAMYIERIHSRGLGPSSACVLGARAEPRRNAPKLSAP